jgi:anaerobic selenocysteine-containing dehydrogenase
MQIFRYAEQGSIKLLWISGTNPAVSLPELARIRAILAQESLFVIVQDLFLSETAALADIVLPAATWGEKTGVFTNADRTVHLSEKAVEPPGDARPDLEIFLYYAAAMGLADKDGNPLISWTDPESAFEAWKRCSAGQPCDYTGLSYDLLRERGGIQWPCTANAPDGTERLYTDRQFWAAADVCESYGRDLITGASVEETEYRALNPDGQALLKAAQYLPPHEDANAEYPMQLITGRTIYHFHTRTKTARGPELNAAAPDVWAELHPDDATALGIADGDPVDVVSPRGRIRATARYSDLRRGLVFLPFHYGYWDTSAVSGPGDNQAGRAANELTITDWDPVSKQPLFKTSACRLRRVEPQSAAGTTRVLAQAEGLR